MRLAAIDIGTNSVHMIVVQVRPDLSFEQAGVIESPFATHLRYRPARERRNGGGNA